jgi:hypothetical protein
MPETRLPSVATSEALFPALLSWRDKTLKDLSYCLASFFNYLAEPRVGFISVVNAPDYELTIKPLITREMAHYVIEEIFPCGAMLSQETFDIYPVPEALRNDMERMIIAAIANPSYVTPKKTGKGKTKKMDLTIEAEVYQVLWNYASHGLDALALGATSDEEVAAKIAQAEQFTLNRRNCLRNYGFNDDIENCAFQALLYVMVSCADWLEVETITNQEVLTAYRIIFPPDLQFKLTSGENKRLQDIITGAILSKDLLPSEEAVGLLISIMGDISRELETLDSESGRRVINRLMAFSQPI